MFQRFLDDGLSQSSYLIACTRTREAAIVDPRRDIDEYVAVAGAHGLSIVLAIETHVHADFVSGARELAALGARPVAGPGAGLAYAHHEVGAGERMTLGDITLTFLHTPGHTPEHIAVLVDEPDAPRRVLTGDILFVGAVGRPDLLGAEQSRQLAGEMYESLDRVLMSLDDTVEVHPGHGAGSLCGSGIGTAASSTIGEERHANAFLQYPSRDEFVAAVLADLPETPPYFVRMKALNRAGPDVLGRAAPPGPLAALDPGEARRLVDSGGTLIIDLRSADAFAALHPTGALHLESGPKVGFWAAWVVPASARVVLLADGERQAADARLQLMRVGIDAVAGFIRGFEAWRAADGPVSSIERYEAGTWAAGQPTLVDVRSKQEFESGHLDGAVHIPLDELTGRAPGLPAGPLAIICESGYRSSLAASLLGRLGLDAVGSIAGGMTAYRMSAHR